MKKIIAIGLSMALAICMMPSLMGQQKKNDWQDRMKAERIAYLTDYMQLTSSEAEKFWPIYNKAEAEEGEAFKQTIDAYRALDEAVSSNKGESELHAALDNYLNVLSISNEIEKKYIGEYRKILSEEKVAKLYLGEEKFRREQIHKLRRGGDSGPNRDMERK